MVPRWFFCIVDVSDHLPVRLGRKIYSAVNDLAHKLRTTRQRGARWHDGHRATQRSPTRRQLGVNPASGCAQGAHETPELVPGRASAAHSPADTLPLVPVGRRWSAARVPASNRARATQVYSLEGCGHIIIGTGPGSHLGPCAARTGARDLRVSVVSIGGGQSTECATFSRHLATSPCATTPL